MRNQGFQKFVVIFVGIVLLASVGLSIAMQDESMIGTTAAVAVLYAVYLTVYLRKKKERQANQQKNVKSPLIRRS